MQPRPWSFSGLDTFTTCARKFHEESILKSVVREETEAQRLGIEAHKAFEERLLNGPVASPLEGKFAEHETYMQEIEEGPGKIYTERKFGLNIKLEPCDFFAKDVWYRGVIDVEKVMPNGTARIVDYKNGKKHNKVKQLHLFSLYGFCKGYTQVKSEFYWIRDKTKSPIVLPSTHAPVILRTLLPDLTRLKEAYRDEVWPPTRNGLCKNYCGVTGCEFHGKGMRE